MHGASFLGPKQCAGGEVRGGVDVGGGRGRGGGGGRQNPPFTP